MSRFPLLAMTSLFALGVSVSGQAATPLTDKIVFGDRASESAHDVKADGATVLKGAMDQPARQLTPLPDRPWRSGDLAFTLKVDAKTQNYATIRLWGGEATENKLVMFCDGKQIGYRHLGDVDILDQGAEKPSYAGRFTYKTFPLPITLTKGKSSLQCQVRALGPFAVYNKEFEKFQKPMVGPGRPLYTLYVHNDPYLESGEKDGTAPEAGVRPSPGPEVMQALRDRINKEITRLVTGPKVINQDELAFLGRAYSRDWTAAYKDPAVVEKVLAAGDALYAKFLTDPHTITQAPDGNASWIAAGPFGETLKLLRTGLGDRLDTKIGGPEGTPITRRDAYAQMLAFGRDFLLQNRRLYTNQSMIVDLMGIYGSNEGLRTLNSELAKPEADMRRYLYESVGLLPWSGSLDAEGKPTYSSSAKDTGVFRLPTDYHIFTPTGLSKELGYVGSYGEIQDLAANIYLATAPEPGQPGDPKLLEQFVKIAKARLYFRYPIIDDQGYRSMALQATIGWRDPKTPGVTTYVQRMGWDNTASYVAMVSKDPTLMAAAQQMMEDNQYYATIQERMENKWQRVTIGLLDAYDEWQAIMSWPKATSRLPMSSGEPDFVFVDPMNAVIAVKHGEERLYAELYWRANCGVNKLSRIHYLTPSTERVATHYGRVEFTPSGSTCTRPTTPHFSAGAIPNVPFPDDVSAALAGEELPIAKMPADARFEGARDNPFAGRGDFYETRYGPYLMAINAATDKVFSLTIPTDQGTWIYLNTRQAIPTGTRTINVQPGQALVLRQKVR